MAKGTQASQPGKVVPPPIQAFDAPKEIDAALAVVQQALAALEEIDLSAAITLQPAFTWDKETGWGFTITTSQRYDANGPQRDEVGYRKNLAGVMIYQQWAYGMIERLNKIGAV